jgi:hypothetical protein
MAFVRNQSILEKFEDDEVSDVEELKELEKEIEKDSLKTQGDEVCGQVTLLSVGEKKNEEWNGASPQK